MYSLKPGPVTFTLAELARLACGQTSLKLSPAGQSILAAIIDDARAGRLPLYGACLSDYTGNRVARGDAVAWFQGRGWGVPDVLIRRRTLDEAEDHIKALESEIELAMHRKPEPIVSERLYRPLMLLLAALVKLVAQYKKERRTKDGAPIVNAIADDVLGLVGVERGLSSASIRNHIGEALRMFDRDIAPQTAKQTGAAIAPFKGI